MTREQVIQFFGSYADVIMPFAISPEMDTLLGALRAEASAGKIVVPEQALIFRAFHETPLEDLRFVILGQDPYPAKGLPDGLAFSASSASTTPKSLQLIYDAIARDAGPTQQPRNNDLSYLAKQGGLLLNASLTTVEGFTNVHKEIWEPFMKYMITRLQEVTRGIIWLGFGKEAQLLLKNVDVYMNAHFLTFEEHPVAALYRAQAENNPNPEWIAKCFSKTNAIIRANKLGELIQW